MISDTTTHIEYLSWTLEPTILLACSNFFVSLMRILRCYLFLFIFPAHVLRHVKCNVASAISKPPFLSFVTTVLFFPAVISPLAAGTRKPWISSPPVRWRCLNAAHALIETRFRLSDNAQSIFCRHRVILEPPNLNNFFDRIDVQLGQLVSSFAFFIFLEFANLWPLLQWHE